MKKKYWISGILIIILLVLLSADKKEKTIVKETDRSVVVTETNPKAIPRGDRRLAIDVGMDKSGDYGKAFALAKDIGMQQIGLYINWTDAEPSPNQYNHPLFPTINTYYPAVAMPIDLTITPINTNQPMLPKDLADKPLNDPIVISRFQKLLDYTFSSLDKVQISSLVIGSEIDVYAGNDKDRWQQYIEFYQTINQYIHQKYPGIKVATELTYSGVIGNAKPYIAELNKTSDIIGLSYYPLKEDFTVQNPKIVTTDFNTMVKLFPSKPIYIYQFGYPSSATNNSSEEKQRQFIVNTFSAWDKYRNNIKMIDFTWLHDTSNSQANKFASFYGGNNKRFVSFLGSLGLRTYDGKDKPAFLELKKQAQARGW